MSPRTPQPGTLVVPHAMLPCIIYSHVTSRSGYTVFEGAVLGRLNDVALVITSMDKQGEAIIYVLHARGVGWMFAEGVMEVLA